MEITKARAPPKRNLDFMAGKGNGMSRAAAAGAAQTAEALIAGRGRYGGGAFNTYGAFSDLHKRNVHYK